MQRDMKKRRLKGTVKSHGATFKINEPGRFVRGEPKQKPSPSWQSIPEVFDQSGEPQKPKRTYQDDRDRN
jgi:hypothetical protein